MHQAFSGRAKNWLRNPRLPEDAPSPIPHAGATGLTRIRALGIEIAEHARRVLASSRQIAHQTAIQSDHVQGSGSVIEDIAHIAGESARLYGIAQSRVAQARFQLEHCGQLSRNRNVTLDAIVQRVTDAQGNLTRLNATVDEVDMLLRQVADIGRQTDLLALNAAIEAARAGQQGEGFQVVAREMRDLADRTAHATTQIQQLTEGMRRSMNGSSTSLREACLNDRESANQAILAKQAYTLSLEAMTDAEQTAGQVVASAERQQKSAETLSQRWAPVLETAIDCGFDADACAERTQQTLELAARLGHELATIESAGRRLPPQRTPADSDHLHETIAAAMHALEAMIGGLGTPSRRRDQDPIPDLYFGTSRMNDRFDEVDALHRRTGFTTTLFVLGQRAGNPVFFRITTNVKRRNGDRVTLTPLNPKGDVARSLLAGQPTYGHVFILGAPYVAAYSPIKDPAGHVIGATYVGRAIDSA